jgi:hypothetical protein
LYTGIQPIAMNTVTATLIQGIKRFIFYVTEEGKRWGGGLTEWRRGEEQRLDG